LTPSEIEYLTRPDKIRTSHLSQEARDFRDKYLRGIYKQNRLQREHAKRKADIELVKNLNNLIESLNSHECELLCEWYNNESQSKDDMYIQMEIDFLEEQEGQYELYAQWDM
jgi:hypothetical protein